MAGINYQIPSKIFQIVKLNNPSEVDCISLLVMIYKPFTKTDCHSETIWSESKSFQLFPPGGKLLITNFRKWKYELFLLFDMDPSNIHDSHITWYLWHIGLWLFSV